MSMKKTLKKADEKDEDMFDADRAYMKFAEKQGWKVDEEPSDVKKTKVKNKSILGLAAIVCSIAVVSASIGLTVYSSRCSFELQQKAENLHNASSIAGKETIYSNFNVMVSDPKIVFYFYDDSIFNVYVSNNDFFFQLYSSDNNVQYSVKYLYHEEFFQYEKKNGELNCVWMVENALGETFDLTYFAGETMINQFSFKL